MLKTQISLLGIIVLVVFVETVLVPGLWTALRIDLLLGMVIGVIVHLGFTHGLLFVLVSSLFLQAFSGARPGLIPLFYLFMFIVVDMLKEIIYLENVTTQVVLAVIFSALAACSLVLFLGTSLSPVDIVPLIAGSLLTGCASPFMVALVGRVKRGHET